MMRSPTPVEVVRAAEAFRAWDEGGKPASGWNELGPYVTDRLYAMGNEVGVLEAIRAAADDGLVEGPISRLVKPTEKGMRLLGENPVAKE